MTPQPEKAREEAPVAWTGSGSLTALAAGLEGYIWPAKAASCPIPLYRRAPTQQASPCYECDSTERIGTACAPCNPELVDQRAVVSEGALERLADMAEFFEGATDSFIAASVCREHAADLREALAALKAQGASEGLKPTPLTDLPVALAAYQARCDEMDQAPPPSSAGEA
jgi:hypothetical protein